VILRTVDEDLFLVKEGGDGVFHLNAVAAASGGYWKNHHACYSNPMSCAEHFPMPMLAGSSETCEIYSILCRLAD